LRNDSKLVKKKISYAFIHAFKSKFSFKNYHAFKSKSKISHAFKLNIEKIQNSHAFIHALKANKKNLYTHSKQKQIKNLIQIFFFICIQKKIKILMYTK